MLPRNASLILISLITVERFYYLAVGWLDRETATIVQALQWGQWWTIPSRAPYGLLWYLTNFWFAFDVPSWTLGIILIDAVVMWLVARKSRSLFLVYALFSWLMFSYAVYDLPILWFIALFIYFRRAWPLSIIAKFPFFAFNDAVWTWIRTPLGVASNWIYYSMLGVFWLAVFQYHVKLRSEWRKKAKMAQVLNMQA